MKRTTMLKYSSLTLTAGFLSASAAMADNVILDDLIVDGSACIGLDCVNGESFGFDTLRLKENNLRIKFQDTSASASFPSNDWQITINDSSNGGANKFSVEDIDGGRTPFTIEAGVPNDMLYLDSASRVGIGTNTPSVKVHVKDGNTPTLRLDQDGSSGFAAQTWDLAGNESNFFIRDVTNGSTLPFRIQPGAKSDMIYLASDDQIGINTSTPDADVHIVGNMRISDVDDATVDTRDLVIANDTGAVEMELQNQGTGAIQIRLVGSNSNNRGIFALSSSGDVASSILLGEDSIRLRGTTNNVMLEVDSTGLSVNGTGVTVPDYVFAPDYELMPLSEVNSFILANQHLPNIPSAAEINAGQLNMTQMQLKLLEKVEELTLYTLAQEQRILDLEQLLESAQ